jgi:hypothetical protein
MFIQGVMLIAYAISNGGSVTIRLLLIMLSGMAFVSLSILSKNHFNNKDATSHRFIASVKHDTSK